MISTFKEETNNVFFIYYTVKSILSMYEDTAFIIHNLILCLIQFNSIYLDFIFISRSILILIFMLCLYFFVIFFEVLFQYLSFLIFIFNFNSYLNYKFQFSIIQPTHHFARYSHLSHFHLSHSNYVTL